MFQLKFNEDFTQITNDIPHWKTEEDIPDYIKKFIYDTSDKRVFYEEETGSFYCGKCVNQLDDSFYCPKCNIQHKKYAKQDKNRYGNKDIIVKRQGDISQKCFLDTACYYFIFDIVEHHVFLYFIEEDISYDNPFYTNPYKKSKLCVNTSKSYFVEKEGVTCLQTNTYISFEDLDQCSKDLKGNSDVFFDNIDSYINLFYGDFALTEQVAYLYTENLIDLKNTVYQYSRIWELDSYLKTQSTYNFAQLTFNPLYYPQFEYLVNYKLYNLALNIPDWFQKGNNFKEIFGIDKKYLPIMVQNDIGWEELELLRIYPTTEIEVIQFFKEWAYGYLPMLRELVNIYKVDLKVLRNYLLKMGLSSDYISEYLDYVHMSRELHLDLKDKHVLYPKNLREAHDELFNQIEVVENPVIDREISNLSNVLSLNQYEDDKYVIFPATSIQSLTEESRQQKNCVRTYCEKVANHECQVYFMRKKDDITKSFVTIEVRNNRIIQARTKYNELPSENIRKILEKWEKSLMQITVINE